jgi:DNA-binding NtrC family response regulator
LAFSNCRQTNKNEGEQGGLKMSATAPTLVIKGDGKVLVVSPHAELRGKILESLGPESLPATEARGGAEALLKLRESDFRTLLLDPNIEDLNVEELIATIRARYPKLTVVVLDQEKKGGQFSFSPCDREAPAKTEVNRPDGPIAALWGRPSESTGHSTDSSRGSAVETQVNYPDGPIAALWGRPSGSTENFIAAPVVQIDSLPGMIGTSPKMQQIYRLARLVAPRDTAVLIVGSTGTGKELVAHSIHQLSRRSQRPFVVVNCAAIPESLLEAELFGFTRGAFTGAFQSSLGRIHAAQGGTLLLDEVAEIPLSMQAKLLRFVQEGEVQRLGSADVFRVNVRLIASTNADLLQRVRDKQFREDLYYRLAVFPLDLPPLRDRPEDILPIARHFLEIFCRQEAVPQKALSPEAVNLLQEYFWPGNVRELQHKIERAFVLSEANQQIRAEDLAMPSRIVLASISTSASVASLPDVKELVPLAEMERRAVLDAVQETRGDKLAAARLLQIGKSTLYRKLKEYGPD